MKKNVFQFIGGIVAGISMFFINDHFDIHFFTDPHKFAPQPVNSLVVPYVFIGFLIALSILFCLDSIRLKRMLKAGNDWAINRKENFFNKDRNYSLPVKILGYISLYIFVYFFLTISKELVHIMEHTYRDAGYPFVLVDFVGFITFISMIWWAFVKAKEDEIFKAVKAKAAEGSSSNN